MYLGYPSFFRYVHYRLEGAFSAIDNDADVQTLLTTALTNIIAIENTINTISLSVAGLKRVDDVEYYKNSQLMESRKLGRMWVSRLSILTGVPIYSDIFGENGYLGDKFSDGGLANSRASNKINLG